VEFKRQRYQAGSVRKVPRAHGFAWEFRYYFTDSEGKRREKVQTFDSALYKTERDVRKTVEGQLAALNANTLAGRAEVTLGQVIDRYLLEVFPQLRHSTQDTDRSMLETHIRPKWGEHRLPDVKAYAVQQWLETLTFGPASKKRAKGMIGRLLDRAMLWEYIPVERNPMELIKVKGAGKRVKKLIIITPAQLKALVDALPAPYNLIVLVIGCLGYRISEALALRWNDIDWKAGTIVVQRVFTHNQEQDVPRTDASGNELPLIQKLV